MLKLCGEAEDKLAQELIHFELQVERDVIEPLFVLAEVRVAYFKVNLCRGSFKFGINVSGSLADLRTGGISGSACSQKLVASGLLEFGSWNERK